MQEVTIKYRSAEFRDPSRDGEFVSYGADARGIVYKIFKTVYDTEVVEDYEIIRSREHMEDHSDPDSAGRPFPVISPKYKYVKSKPLFEKYKHLELFPWDIDKARMHSLYVGAEDAEVEKFFGTAIKEVKPTKKVKPLPELQAPVTVDENIEEL